jgi:hypothetical protein
MLPESIGFNRYPGGNVNILLPGDVSCNGIGGVFDVPKDIYPIAGLPTTILLLG